MTKDNEIKIKIVKSFIVDKINKLELPKKDRHVPIGTWMIEYYIDKNYNK